MGVFPVNTFQTYQQKSVWISSGAFDTDQTVSGSLRQLARVQSLNYNLAYPVEQVTYLDIGDEAYLSSHTPVEVNLAYLHTNGRNEQALGLLDVVGPNGALALNLDQEKNLYVATQNVRGVDSVGTPSGASQSVIALGQAVMTAYSMSARLGSFVQSSATLNCLTAYSYTGNAGNQVPAVHYQNGTQLTGLFTIPQAFSQYDPNVTGYDNPIAVAAIGAQDMYMAFPQGTPFGVIFSGAQASYLQGFDLTLAFDRRELKPLGNVYPNTRALLYPIRIDLSADAVVNSYQADQLSRIDCLGTGQAVFLIVKQPCSNITLFGFYFDKLQLESQSFSSSIGPSDTVNLKWRGLITSPSTVFFSPLVNQLVNADTNLPFGLTW